MFFIVTFYLFMKPNISNILQFIDLYLLFSKIDYTNKVLKIKKEVKNMIKLKTNTTTNNKNTLLLPSVLPLNEKGVLSF